MAAGTTHVESVEPRRRMVQGVTRAGRETGPAGMGIRDARSLAEFTRVGVDAARMGFTV